MADSKRTERRQRPHADRQSPRGRIQAWRHSSPCGRTRERATIYNDDHQQLQVEKESGRGRPASIFSWSVSGARRAKIAIEDHENAAEGAAILDHSRDAPAGKVSLG